MTTNTGLSENELRLLLNDTDIPVPQVYQTVTSTNILAKEAAENGAASWSCIAAKHQSAGRGRLGRNFFSPEGSGIYFSVILHPSQNTQSINMLTPTAAVAMCLAAEEDFGVAPDIKWVNDIYLNSKKVCGILTEASFGGDSINYAVVGVGVNLFVPVTGFPDNISDTAGSLLEVPQENAENRIIASFLKHYKALCTDIKKFGAYIADEYRRRCFILGKEINIIRSGEIIGTAVAIDTDDACRLVVQHSDGKREALSAGEISIRMKG